MSAETKNIGICPDCGGEVRFKKMPYVGQTANCRTCSTLLEVVNRFPIELDWAEIQWDEDEEFNEYKTTKSDRRNKESW